ncbi:MAG: extracellular solute-binding protein [Roseburia sp.]|nr:extracellular solute-binding protein [Roseburia sp.]
MWAIESSQITDYSTNAQSLWMEEQTGVAVNYLAVPAQGWYNAFQASVMGNEEVDIYLYPFDTMEAEMLGSQMDYIIPLEDLITPENTPNIYSILEKNPQLKELITAPDGHIYTLFENDVYQLSAYTQKLWVNRQFLEKYTDETGNQLPATTEEFEQMLVYFNTHDMNGDGLQNELPYTGMLGVEGIYNLVGSFIPANSNSNGFGCYRDNSGEIVFSYMQEEYKEALTYIQELYQKGLINPDTFTISAEERYSLTSGDKNIVRTGVVSAVSAEQVVKLTGEENSMTYDDYIALPPLEGPKGVRSIMSTGETSISLRNAITTKCQNPVAAIKWLDAGYSEIARMYAVYGGLENVHWTYTDGENINGKGKVITTKIKDSENICWGGQGIVYSITEEDYLLMDAAQIATNSDLATYRANLAYRPYMVKNEWPAIIWAGSYASEAEEYSELNGLIKKTVTEYYTDVILGRKNLESDWDSYINTLKEIGINRFVELVELYSSVSK